MITFNKFGLLSSKLTSNVKQFWLNKSLFGRTLLLSMLMFGVSQPVLATVTNYQSSDFKCDTLYAATPGYIYSVNLTNAQGSLMYRVTNSGSWAGGEVNQVTGQLYITGAYNANIQNNYQMALITPKINAGTASIDSVTLSGTLVPLPGQTAITGEVSSDMAIDAEGNAYMIVGRQSTRQLIRVQPPKNGISSWYYNVVADLSGFNTEQIWGMAFLNGRLYTSHSGGSLYEVDVLSGSATRIGSINSSTSGTVRDLASCQVAPVIKGKIYNDKTGSATNISSLDGVENIDVELWKGNKWYKTFTTNATGEYSFIVDSTDVTVKKNWRHS